MIEINQYLLNKVSKEAKTSERKRKNYNFHTELSDPLQRLLNAMEPDTYVQPHKHENPDKREAFIILSGTAGIIEFDESGNITGYTILNQKNGNYGVEIAPGTFHTVVSLENNTVVYEIKDGPYSPIDDKNFATWAPHEKDPEAIIYLLKLKEKIGFV